MLRTETITDHMRKHTKRSLRWAEYMIIEGFNVNERDNLNWTPLHYAVFHGNTGATAALLIHGAKVDARNAELFQTPLHIAAEKGFYTIAKTLLVYGADIHALDREHSTPLDLAVRNDRNMVMKLLKRHGAR